MVPSFNQEEDRLGCKSYFAESLKRDYRIGIVTVSVQVYHNQTACTLGVVFYGWARDHLRTVFIRHLPQPRLAYDLPHCTHFFFLVSVKLRFKMFHVSNTSSRDLSITASLISDPKIFSLIMQVEFPEMKAN